MNDRKPGPNEVKAKAARAFDRECIGCKRYDAAVMLSFSRETADPTTAIVDVYMDAEQAEGLLSDLKRIVLSDTYPSRYPPGSHWAQDEAWTILDTIKPGVVPVDVRALFAGMIAGALTRIAKEGPPKANHQPVTGE